MNREFWQAGWDRGRIGFHQHEINAHLKRHWSELGVAPGAKVLVPLCGKSLDMLWLRDRGQRVVGVEIVRRAVEAFFTENALPVTTRRSGPFVLWAGEGIEIYEGDFFDLTATEASGVEAVYDRASLIALPPAVRPRYATHLRAVLHGKTNILLVTMEYPEADMEGPPFSVTADEVAALYDDSFRIVRVAREDVLSANPGLRDRGLTRLIENVYLLQSR